MIWDKIPNELKSKGLWCCWKLTQGKKLPYNAVTDRLAKSNDKTTFHPFMTVLTMLSKYYSFDKDGKMAGGLGLGIFNGFSAVDIDHCIDDEGSLSLMAQDIVNYCKSYTEVSPSGTGIRIIFKTQTKLDKELYYINNHNNGLEIYISEQTNKYVTITGNSTWDYEIRDIDISYILEKYMIRKNAVKIKSFDISKYKNDEKLKELWNKKAPGKNADESENDLGLCNKLAYYLKGDYSAVAKAFMESPYYKSKDPAHIKKWKRKDYSENTIKLAVQNYFNSMNRIDNFGLTDTGNAHKFVDRFGDSIRYNYDNKMWMVWNGKYWQYDIFGSIKNYLELVIEEMKMQAKFVEEEGVRKAMLTNVKRALSSSGKTAMLKESEHLQGIPVTNNDFDNEPFLFNCESGVLDLKAGKILTHDKSLMVSKYSPVTVSKKKPTKWLKFLDEIFNNDAILIEYVQRVLGYAITGSSREQCLFILVGDGSNGKSLLLEIFSKIMGSYGSTSNIGILVEKYNQSSANMGDVARLNKMRMTVTEEPKLGDKLNESTIKTMTSGLGEMVARFLYGNEFQFIMNAKIFMAANYKPVIRGTDHGIWRRIRIIPFDIVIPDEKQDLDLINKLTEELPEIFGWILAGCRKWLKEGLKSPAVIKNSIHEYKSEMDIIDRWVNETCDFKASYRASSSELFANFCNYVSANREFQISNTMFGKNLVKKFKRKRFGNINYYLGLQLKKDNNYRIDRKKYDEI